MCIQELPDPNQSEEQVALVTNHLFQGLIRQFLPSDSDKTPNMEHIIVEYFKPNLSVQSLAPATKRRCNLRTSENGERHERGKERISLVERIFFRNTSNYLIARSGLLPCQTYPASQILFTQCMPRICRPTYNTESSRLTRQEKASGAQGIYRSPVMTNLHHEVRFLNGDTVVIGNTIEVRHIFLS